MNTTNSSNSGKLIALDWGTTNVRAALMDDDGNVIDERRAESGVGSFDQSQFEARFNELTTNWAKAPVIAAGMVGSRQGWREADYQACPTTTNQLANNLLTFDYNAQAIHIVPGLKLDNGKRYDVMRGEESQLAGFLTANQNFTGTVLMPGTHSKWVKIEDDTIVNFQTYMTGEVFEAISQHSILKHSVSDPNGPDSHFTAKAEMLVKDGGSIEGELFGLRARHLLEGRDAGLLRQELSALLIMAELRAGLLDGFNLENEVILVGTETLTAFYETALAAMGKKSLRIRGTKLIWPALYSLALEANILNGNAQ